MEDYRLDQSGQEVQDILNGAAMQVDLTAETERATEAEQTLQGNIDAEATRAQGAEGTLQDNIDAEEARAKAAEKQNADDIDAIEEKIPSGASSSNKLATEEYVADAVATATATFRGTYNLVSDLHLTVNATEQQIAAALAGAISTADNNDYCFILVPTSSETPTEIKEIDRYKFNGTAWAFEYKLNNSGFNAAQWAAINSGITSGDVAKLAALPTNAQLTTLLAGLQSDIDGEEARAKGVEGTLQDNIDAEETRAKAAEKQIADDIDAIEAVLPENASSENKVATESEINSLSAAIEAILLLIPSAATSLNKLADKAFVNSSIATATATFRGTYNLVDDLGLTTSATHAQIATALAGAILTADNNDYAFVQIPTSDAMPTEIAKTERYKFNGTAWEYEYDLNNSGFTADQWAAINSGITQALVTKLSALPTNAELTTELGTLTSGINTINQKIPNAASQANKLVDTAAMESYIVQVLDVLTASFNVTSTDGHVTVQISQVDGKITSVAVSTSDIASAADLNLKASQADLTALASRVTTAEGNITTLGGRITTAEGNITSLGGRMTTAEGNITTINGNITSLGGRVSTNETDIANLQELYNSLQQSKPVPVDALPETGQQQGVIYRLSGTTSYSDYMWNGSTWVLMATYNNAIDPRPKKNSQNLVTSGGIFDNMGALDVSELNATENPHTIAKYVDLSAALAAIPTDYQKGGMSIKFVQSSDNKYVQYRLTSSSFSINEVDWQGVDEVPVAGSDNLVKSGGVASAIKSVDEKIESTITLENGNIDANGDEVDNPNRVRTKGFLTAPFSIETNSGYQIRVVYAYFNGVCDTSKTQNVRGTYVKIENTNYQYRVSFNKDTDTTPIDASENIIKEFIGHGLVYDISELQKKCDGLSETLYGENQTLILERNSIDGQGQPFEPSSPHDNRARTANFIKAPFSLVLNNGYKIKTVYFYDLNGEYESAEGNLDYDSYNGVDDTKLYKFVFNKSDLSDFTDSDLSSMVDSFEGDVKGLVERVTDLEKKVLYVSPSGNDNNSGTKTSKLATFQKAINLGAKIIIAESGDYTNQKINAISNNGELTILCMDSVKESQYSIKKPAVINNGVKLTFSDDSQTGLKRCSKSFDTDSNWYKVFVSQTLTPIRPQGTYIPAQGSSTRSDAPNAVLYAVVDGEADKWLTPVLTLADCQSTADTVYYDHTNGYIYVNNIQNAEYYCLNEEEGLIASFEGYSSLILENIAFRFSPCWVKVKDCSNIKMMSVEASYCAYGTGIRPENSNIKFTNCLAHHVCGDGFSASFGGHCEYYDCVAHHCGDDGISCHTGCTGFVSGGEFYNCGKGALAPGEGSRMDIQGAFCHDSDIGIQSVTSPSNPNLGLKVRHSNCALYNNRLDYDISNYHVLAVDMHYTTKRIAENQNTSLTEIQ